MLTRRWLEMTWRDALFCHWPVDPAVVSGTIPDRLSVATHGGDAYLSVVAFVMDDIRPRGAPVGLSFPELNLRTYVEGPDGRGVYFYNLDAEDPIGVALARRLFALPYYRAEMDVRRPETADPAADEDGPVRFTSRRTHPGVPHARFDATYEPTGEPFAAESGSLDAFLVENYQFYAEGNRLYRGAIAHEPWTLRAATADIRANTLFRANGFDRPDGDPIVRYAEPIAVGADRIRFV
ncbi:hypothetical protein DJ71_25215 [Halorubrum sp. E3]|uniref:DUF2071 domain-containing protein n=1 Tax=Halorubrum persicum TaxID=1383844 RepID=A0A2G1WN41_9EURY|nr:DUF2071 domain-containing protein [Halorubrum persicum]OYR59541.1 hypothetical protein DJ71_25215 [Halorubrum sp. E3]PHQ40289.1 hypothetical protein DJ69_01735 [Halorubrum persicum]